jgi:hypothetical protein
MRSQRLRSATRVLAFPACALLIWGASLVAFTLWNWSPWWPDDLSVPSAAKHYNRALQAAVLWSGDAYLTDIDAGQSSLTYTFQSPSRKNECYRATLSHGAWAFAFCSDALIQPHDCPLDSVEACSRFRELEKVILSRRFPLEPPIQRHDWPLDSIDALSTAQENGGQELLGRYRRGNPSISARLDRFYIHGVEDVLAWQVTYMVWEPPRLPPDGLGQLVPGGHLNIWIDPRTGDVLQVETG